MQSSLDPAGDDAGRLLDLATILFAGGTVIFLGTMALALAALLLPASRRGWLSGRTFVVLAGVAFPTVTLTVLLGYALWALRVTNVPRADPLVIEVSGEQYWWRVRYPAEGERPEVVTANEIQVPAGRPVRVELTAADVIHSFWIPNFAGKVDMIPGRRNVMLFTPERTGVFRGVCTEFCGEQHARMAFDVVVLEPAAFEGWRDARARPAAAPSTESARLGHELFRRNGCGSCHVVRGTEFGGALGPDLTHVGSRRTIGAGSYPNNAGTLGGWIADTQHLKSGARMPSYGSLSGTELRAVAGYLEALK